MNPFLFALIPVVASDVLDVRAAQARIDALWLRLHHGTPQSQTTLEERKARCTGRIPKDAVLFHGTGLGFAASSLQIDENGVVGFSVTPDVAQHFIPCATRSIFVDARTLAAPSSDPDLILVQRALGFSWPAGGTGAVVPRLSPTVVLEALRDLGYVADDVDQRLEVRFDGTRLLAADACREGKLIVAKVVRPMFAWDLTGVGPRPDLLVPYFRELDRMRCDAVLAWESVMSPRWGTVNAPVVYVTRWGLSKLEVTTVPARHFDWPRGFLTATTPDWERALPIVRGER